MGLLADIASAPGLSANFTLAYVGLAGAFVASVSLVVLSAVAIVLYRRVVLQTRHLADSREQLQLILDNMTEGIFLLDENRNVLLMNKAASGLMPVPGENHSYHLVNDEYEVLTPDGEPMPVEQWPSSRALRGDFVRREVLFYRHKITGELGSREVNTVAVPTRPGQPRQIIVSYRDDTERRRADDAHARLVAIVESSNDAIIGKDLNGIVTSWNSGAEKIFGYSSSEMIGESIKCLIPSDRTDEEDGILRRISSGETVDHFNTVRLTKEGNPIHVSLTISPIRDSAGKIIGASKIARDITETRSLERQLRQSQKLEAIGQLTGGIAHDFNNLLAIILGNLELLESDIAVKANTHAEGLLKIALCTQRAATAKRAAQRAADLTRRLLAFSSNDQLNPAPLDLGHAIRNTLELATRALGPEIIVSLDLDTKLPAVLMDSAGFEGALLNLLVNARDAMPKGGTLRISSKACELTEEAGAVQSNAVKAGHYACVTVSDNGEGMPQEVLERAFEPFFTTKGVGRGTGLGLAMVYGFLKQSNGTARIYSEPGYGTTITLYLPFADEKAFRPAPPVLAHHAARAGGTILLVDDEADLLDIATAYLERLGYTILKAKDGTSAMRMIDQRPDIDVMVTDIVMPGGMNGVEMAQRIAEIRPEVRVVYTSGFPADALAQKNLAVEGSVLLHKPYRLAELGAVVRLAMGEATRQ